MKLFKNTILTITLIIMIFIITGCDNADSSNNTDKETGEVNKETITLTVATGNGPEEFFSQAIVQPFMDRAEELTDGQVEFDYKPAEQLGKSADLLDLTSSGVADIGYYVGIYYPDQMPLTANVISLPSLFDSSVEGTKAYQVVSNEEPMLTTDFLSNGVRPLVTWTNITYDIQTNGKEIKVPDDLKGVQLRSGGGIMNAAEERAGAIPVQMGAADAYTAIDRNTIDGIHLNTVDMIAYGLDEVIKFATKNLNFGSVGVGLIINDDVYKKLPENVQKALIQAGEEAAISGAEKYDTQKQESYEALEEQGIRIHEPTESERAEWDKFYNEFNKYWQEKEGGEDFDKALNSFEELIKKNE